MKPHIILDTDPGGDDAVALLWVLSLVQQGNANLTAVTSVGGNVAVAQTFANASRILALGGFQHIEVGRGVAINSAALDASHIHGQDGMGGLSNLLPVSPHQYELARSSEDIIIHHLTVNPGVVTLVAIGPLTNLAAAEAKCPGILRQAREVVVMGGAFRCRGNVTSHAEFNLWFDSEAAQVVLQSGSNVVVIGLDVTHRLIFTRDMAQAVQRCAKGSAIATFLVALSECMIATNLSYRETGGIEGFLVHDAATLAYLFYPETLLFRRAQVDVETQGERTRGQTLMDDRHVAKPGANAWVALQVDHQTLLANLVEDLKRFVTEHKTL